MTFVVGYAPTDNQSVGKKNAFWTALESVLKEVPGHEQLFVLMDANTRTGRRGGRKLASEECKALGAYGRDTLNDYGKRLLSFPANNELALLNTFFSTAKNAISHTFKGRDRNVLTAFSRGNEAENSCGMLLCTPNRHSYLSRTTTSSHHI